MDNTMNLQSPVLPLSPSPPLDASSRRDFLRAAAGAGAALAGLPAAPAADAPGPRAEPFVGIHIAPHSVLDEGIDYCLDLLHDQAAVSVLLLSPYCYYGAMNRPRQLMGDHGVPLRDNASRKLPMVWVRHHDACFQDTKLRHAQPATDTEYAGREVFAELLPPLRRRGMKLHARIYEPGAAAAKHIANLDQVLTTTLEGKPGDKPCWNNPDYRAWVVGTMRDLFQSYELDGVQYGAERVSPLSQLLYGGKMPDCFCPHCLARGRTQGIDAQQARHGFTELYEFLQGQLRGQPRPADGVIPTVLRTFLKYPAVLAWDYQWHVAGEEMNKLLRDAVKAARPGAQVGRHVDHAQGSWDLVYRAAVTGADLAASCDYVKPILYHEILGPRIKGVWTERLRKTLLSELSQPQSLDLYYALFGYDPHLEPKLAEIAELGLSPDYVYRETKRFVSILGGKAAVYSGIGIDIPKGGGWGTTVWKSDPERLAQAVRRSFEAGAAGVVACREYEENSLESLRIFGRAVREANA